MALITARANGGPRNGIKLSCPELWDGRVRKSEGRTGGITYYAGHYTLNTYKGNTTWLWIDELH